jgi:hypothetical protein
MNIHSNTHTYVGRLEAGCQAVYVVGSESVERLSPPLEGFGWGADAVGLPATLAHELLADASGADPGAEAARRFAAQVLARLPHDGFTLPRDAVSAWLRRTVAV